MKLKRKWIFMSCLFIVAVWLFSAYKDYDMNYFITDIEPQNAIKTYMGISEFEVVDTYTSSHSKLYLLKLDQNYYVQAVFKKHLIFPKYKADSLTLLSDNGKGAYNVLDAWYDYRYTIENDKINVFYKENFISRNNVLIFIVLVPWFTMAILKIYKKLTTK